MKFGEQDDAENQQDQLKSKALMRLKERRMRLKSSAIFNASEIAPKKVSKTASTLDDEENLDDMSDVDEADKEDYLEEMRAKKDRTRELIDLTTQQVNVGTDASGLKDMDDFDLLDATIDPTDVRSMERVKTLEEEIQYEMCFIAAKAAFKFGMQGDDPMKLKE